MMSRVSRSFASRYRIAGTALLLAVASSLVTAQDRPQPQPAPGTSLEARQQFPKVQLTAGRSTVVSTAFDVTRIAVTNPAVADAVVVQPREILIDGKSAGTVSLIVWGATERRQYDIVVEPGVSTLQQRLQALFPGEDIQVSANDEAIILSGRASSNTVSLRAAEIAAATASKAKIVNLLQLPGGSDSQQVLLQVRFAEVSRNAMTELGASFFTSPTGIKNTIGRLTTQQFAAPGFDNLTATKQSSSFGAPVTSSTGSFTFSDMLNLFLFNQKYDIGAMVRLLQTRGMFQSLAEPNLVSESGKEASFLAGGEFPIPIAQGSGANIGVSVVFKEFGIRLSFTPTVTGDRVHLKVKPEVSSLDFANAVSLAGFRIPALISRKTETELELQDGQTFAIAGLMSNTVSSTLSKVPGIGDIPILGQLFRSKAAQKNQTELVVMITPEILARNSPGVTTVLPRTPEPFLPALTPKQSTDMPPPAFRPARPGDDASSSSPAAAVAVLTGAARPAAQTAAPQPVAANPVPSVGFTRPLTSEEKKALERSRKQDEIRKAADAKEQAKRDEADRKNEKAEQERQATLAAEQAKRDAEQAKQDAAAAKVAAEQAKRQAEIDRKHQKLLDEAQAKAKDAAAKYEAELAKKQK